MYQKIKNLTYIRKTILCFSLLHMLIVYATIPYIIHREQVSDYMYTFPTALWMNKLILSCGILLFSIFILWFYNIYVPDIFAKHSLYARVFIVFLSGFYISFQYIFFPFAYAMDGDYTSLADMATYGYPVFWQNYLTSICYLFAFLVLCHPVSVSVVQGLLLSMVLGYILDECLNYTKSKKVKTATTLLFVIAGLCYNRIVVSEVIPHRISLWVIPVLYVCVRLLSCLLKKDYSLFTKRQYYILSGFFAVICYWRTESTLLIVMMPICFFIHIKTRKESIHLYMKQIVTGILLSAAVYIILSIPSWLVSTPIYKNDYQLVNYSGWIQRLIQEEDFDISYDGGKDLDTFSYYIPMNLLPTYGSGAYHYSAEFSSGNCTVTSWTDKEREEYQSAVFNIIRHNMKSFIHSRLIMFLETNKYIFVKQPYTDDYYEKHLVGYGTYHFSVVDYYKEIGTSSIYTRTMFSNYLSNIGKFQISFYQWFIMAAVLLVLLLFLYCFYHFFGSVLTELLGGKTDIINHLIMIMVSVMLIFFSTVICLLFYKYFYLLPEWITDTQPFFELIWFALSIVFILFGNKRGYYEIGFIYIILVLSIIPVIVFAPMVHYMYYNGIFLTITMMSVVYMFYLAADTEITSHSTHITFHRM